MMNVAPSLESLPLAAYSPLNRLLILGLFGRADDSFSAQSFDDNSMSACADVAIPDDTCKSDCEMCFYFAHNSDSENSYNSGAINSLNATAVIHFADVPS